MIRIIASSAVLSILLVSSSCQESKPSESVVSPATEYAKGFSVGTEGPYTTIEVSGPYSQNGVSLKYLLVPKNEKIPPHEDDVQIVRTPVERIVCTSTSHIALLDHLGAVDKLVGFPTTDLISSARARARIDSGLVIDLGVDKEINLELLVSLKPDMVMGYSLAGDMVKLEKIKELGIPIVINGEYLEEHPLGRAEWIKYMSLFLGAEKMADSIFNNIKNEYLLNQALADKIDLKPTVISGILYGDAWFLPGGQNYAARLFRDAGYNYLWSDDPSNSFLKQSFESVYAAGKDADYWIGVGSFLSKEEMKNTEKRYTLFRSFNESNIFTYDARKGDTGGSEYFELGYSRPDIILKDLIKIAHPELLPEHRLFFHRKLN